MPSRRSHRWSSINDSMRFYRESILLPNVSDTPVRMAERLVKRVLRLMAIREAGFEFGWDQSLNLFHQSAVHTNTLSKSMGGTGTRHYIKKHEHRTHVSYKLQTYARFKIQRYSLHLYFANNSKLVAVFQISVWSVCACVCSGDQLWLSVSQSWQRKREIR